MASAIQTQFQIESNLIKSSGGVFEVTVDEKLIFSKKQTGRFPSDEEVLAAIQQTADK